MSARREALVARFQLASVERIQRARRALSTGADEAAMRDVLRDLHTIKGESRMLGFVAVSSLAHAVEERLGGAPPSDLTSVERALDTLARALRGDLGEGVEAERALAEALGELCEDAAADAPTEVPPRPITSPAPSPSSAPEARRSERWMRVDSAHVDDLCERIAGFSAAFGQLRGRVEGARGGDEGARRRALGEELELCNVELQELTEAAWALRLVPVEPALAELAQHARELAGLQRKPLRVEIHAGGAELERTVLDGLWEPLLHLVRNAVDHGIEAPGARGDKDPQARLSLSAKSDGASVILAVEDDGRGIEADEIRGAAVARGLLDRAAARELSDEAALALIFHHGFSTRAIVTDMSGRGVGLDVVKDRVEGFGGEVTIRADPGRGTRFSLSVPSSVTRERMLVVGAGGALYGILARSVRAVVRPAGEIVSRALGGDVLHHEGDAIPLRSLGAILGVGEGADEPLAIVIEASGKRWAFRVGAVLGERDLLRRPVDPIVADLGPVGGSSTLDDGRLVLLLRPASIAASAARGVKPPAPAVEGARGRALVVDDSPVIRDLLTEILVSAGLEVAVAADGAAALARIAEQRPSVVVSDVEMPGMDGFELLRRIREQSHRLPVIMVTTRGSAEDRRHAAALGADAYVSKSEFDGATLLDAVRRFVDVAR